MTKKDYVLLARVIKNNSDNERWQSVFHGETGRDYFIQNLSIELKKDNSRFDVSKFMKACI